MRNELALSVAISLACGGLGACGAVSGEDPSTAVGALDATGGGGGASGAPPGGSFVGGFGSCDSQPGAVVFQQGRTIGGVAYAGATDTQIEEALPTTPQGSLPSCVVKGGSNQRSCLFRWDLSSLPSTTVVQQACLTLTIEDSSVRDFDTRELKVDWAPAQATWLVRQTGTSWELPGAKGSADRFAEGIFLIPGGASGPRAGTIPTAMVQQWVASPSTNHGIVLANSAAFDGITLATSEAVSAFTRPKLTIVPAP